MKKLVVSIAALALVLSGCTVNKSINKEGMSKEKYVSFLAAGKPCGEKKEKPVKYPAFNKIQAKRAILGSMKVDGGRYATANLVLGTFRAGGSDIELYAALAQNGLVNVSNEAVLNPKTGKYVDFLTVSLTPKGKKYVNKGLLCDRTEATVQENFPDLFAPEHNRNAYGELYEDPCIDSTANAVIKAFFKTYCVNENTAIEKFCDFEFTEAIDRIARIDDYRVALGLRPNLSGHVFTAGKQLDSAVFTTYRVNKYENCYKVRFDSGDEALIIMTDSHEAIFDLVLNERRNTTVRRINAQYKEAQIEDLAVAAAKVKPRKAVSATEEERVWVAPGLVLSKKSGRTDFELACEKEHIEIVSVNLYKVAVDRIDKVTVHARPSRELTVKYDFCADARVIMKIVGITPFQYILEKYDESVDPVGEEDIYNINEDVEFTYFKDCGWTI